MTNTYKVVIRKSAIKKLSKLPIADAVRLSKIIKSLSIDPRPKGCKKLKGLKNQYRLRKGNYRIRYTIDDDILIVEVITLGHRKDIYLQ